MLQLAFRMNPSRVVLGTAVVDRELHVAPLLIGHAGKIRTPCFVAGELPHQVVKGRADLLLRVNPLGRR
jgi:hypothetical protein